MKGKIPPQAVDIEEAILGAVLNDSTGIIRIGDKVNSEMFYKHEHVYIWEAIEKLHEKGSAIDLLTIAEQLNKDDRLEKSGGEMYLVDLSLKSSTAANIETHVLVLKEKFVKRELISKASTIIDKSYEAGSDIFELISDNYDLLNNLNNAISEAPISSFSQMVDESIKRARGLAEGTIKPGLPTPINIITRKTGGFADTDFIVIAARPGMGKTAYALAAARTIALQGDPVGFFSLEMSRHQLVMRLIAQHSEIEIEKLTRKGISIQDLADKGPFIDQVKDLPIFIDDTPGITIQDIQIRAKKMHAEHGVKIIFIDYMQLINAKAQNREQEISKISMGCKRLAKELNIPVVALSQLSRAVETRGGNKRPMLSDLRDSGSIEQDADVVNFLYRPEYYNIEYWDDAESTPSKGEVEIIYAKFRNGSLDSYRAKFIGKYTTFKDILPTSPHKEISIENAHKELPRENPNDVFGDESPF